MSEVSDTELLREAGGEVAAWVKKAPLLILVPSIVLAGSAVLDRYV